jgi:hypothetical protein
LKSDKWTNQSTDKTGLTVDCMTSDRGFNVLKAINTIPQNIEAVFRTICDGRYRQSYDVNIAETCYLKKIAENTTVIYQASKKILVVSERDFVLISHMKKVSPTLALT